MRILMLCLLNVAMLLAGQLMFKIGAGGKDMSGLSGILSVLLSPMIVAAIALYALTTVLWLYILSSAPLSYAYPIQALAYPGALALSALLLKENVGVLQWVGAGIICIGVALVAKSDL